VHNLSPVSCTVPLQLEHCDESFHLVDLLMEAVTRLDAKGRVEIPLEGYGYRWLRVMSKDSRRLA
jgi:hypothetical protein